MMNTDAQISWQDYVAILIRRRWFFIVPCAAIILISTVVGFCLPRVYKAQTTLLVEDPKIMNPLMQGMAVATPVDRRMQVVQQELLGWTSLSRLASELELDKQASTPAALEGLVKGLQKDIAVEMLKSGLITLSYMHPDPQMAQRVLNTVTDIYIRRNVESQNAEAESAIRFIESEMTVYKKKLEDSERDLREFKELYAMDMPVATHLNNQVIGLKVQLAQLLVENTEEHPTVVQVRRQIAELRAKRDEDIKKVVTQALLKGASPEIYGDLVKTFEAPATAAASSSPAVDPKLQAARDAYAAWVDRMDGAALSTAIVTIPSAPAQVPMANGTADPSADGLVELEEDGTPQAIALGPRQEQELARLRRDYKVHAGSYQEMKRRLERAKMTQRLGQSDEGTKFKVIEPARLPLHPVSPNLWLIFTGSLAIGLFAGICAAFAAEYFDQSFQSGEDLQTALALPVVGSISTIVTELDLRNRRERMKGWVSLQQQAERVHRRVLQPVWNRVDRWLVRWGL